MFSNHEVRNLLYNAFGFVSWFMYFLYNYLQYKDIKGNLGTVGLVLCDNVSLNPKLKPIAKKRRYSAIIISEIVFFTILQISPGPTGFSTKFGDLLGTGANYFGIVLLGLVLISISCMVLWIDPIKLFDTIAPSYALALIFIKLACASVGCCRGMPWERGPFNYHYDRNEVPIQLIEAGVAVLIFIFLLFYKKKAKRGTIMPMYLIVYGGTRFFTEFLRGEDNIWGPLKNYHIQCIVAFIFGLILYVIAIKYSDKITTLFTTTTYFKKGNFHERIVEIREYVDKTDFSKASKDEAQIKRKRKKPVIK